jgi:hypothetical protein
LKSSRRLKPTQHQACHRKVNERLAGVSQSLVVFAQPAAVVEPRECALHDPAAWYHDKALLLVTAQDLLQAELESLCDPRKQSSFVAAINPDEAQLLGAASESLEEESSTFNVGFNSRFDLEKQAVVDHIAQKEEDINRIRVEISNKVLDNVQMTNAVHDPAEIRNFQFPDDTASIIEKGS